MATAKKLLTVDEIQGAWSIMPTPAKDNASDWRATDTVDLDETARADCTAQRLAVGAGNRRLAGGVDLGHDQRVRGREHLREVVEQVACSRVTMRLEHQHDAATLICLSQRVERGAVQAVGKRQAGDHARV